jgi:transketolase
MRGLVNAMCAPTRSLPATSREDATHEAYRRIAGTASTVDRVSGVQMWSSLDDEAVRYSRALAMDAVQKVGNGHPGTAMSLAPVAYLLFRDYVRHDPTDPAWLGRDRFVLSAGHSSLTLYTQLLLSGTGLEMADLAAFRTWGSATPGHPEFGHTTGVETTTGPLGQGVATGVGIAMATRFERGLFDPAGKDCPFDSRVWVLASDGDLQEGVSGEASSLAGTQHLSNLCVIWDDNRISIEGDTALAFTEDVCARYAAYDWQTHRVKKLDSGDVDLDALRVALDAAMSADRPTFIAVETTIAWPAPQAQNTAKSHGSALGAEEVAETKHALGLNPDKSFAFPVLDEVRHARRVRAADQRSIWQSRFDDWRQREPQRATLLDRLLAGRLPESLAQAIPTFPVGSSVATRKASGIAINAIAEVMPELWGGSADLAESNNTMIDGASDFLPHESLVPNADPYGRVVHFGVREHAMGSILNGMALDGLTRPFGGTFLVFSDYMRGAVRLAALMGLPVTYVWSHDSVGLGEDGPTHQPVEHLWSLRAIPGLSIVRPADANETAAAWHSTLEQDGPVGLILTRQDVPVIVTPEVAAVGVSRGGYILSDVPNPTAIIMATGSEVQIAVAAAQTLAAEGIAVRVVSLPCLEWFDATDAAYQASVLPPEISARVAIEAGATQGWWKYVGSSGRVIGLDHFGASASGATLFTEFGLTSDAVCAAVRSAVEASSGT